MSTQRSSTIDKLLERAIANALARAKELEAVSPNDLIQAAKFSHALVEAAKDVRTLATAFAHGVEEPRPDLGALAAGQGVTASGLRRRYPDSIREPLADLDREESVDSIALLRSLVSLEAPDLLGIHGELDRSLETDFGSLSPSQLVGENISRLKLTELPRLSDLLNDQAWSISTETPSNTSKDVESAYSLTGRLFHALAAGETYAAYRIWIGIGGGTVTIEWTGGPTIDQTLPLILPLAKNGALVQGIVGLALKRFDATATDLRWKTDAHSINVRLFRS
ncbi:hypothetical protein [Brevibacterium aurantiacum]|uniref:hypothetical protein n=1 Tax=Brevibacterium aurantiacum TaxID=273384 RepID=UPI000F649FC9|nr:hypothetical protein [Brevibacterium aurantiacum]